MEVKLSVEQNKALAEKHIVDNIYANVTLEGSTLSKGQVKAILENTEQDNISMEDIIHVKNLKTAWRYLLSSVESSPSIDNLLELNHYISMNQSVASGNIRTGRVEMAGTEFYAELIQESEVVEELYSVLRLLDVKARAVSFFTWACLAYPFWSDNISTANLYANKMLIQNGEGIFYVKDENKEMFTKLLHSYYETGEDKAFFNFIYENCIEK